MSSRGFAGRADLLRAAVAAHGAEPPGSKEAIKSALAPLARLLDLHPQPEPEQRSDLPAGERQQPAADAGNAGPLKTSAANVERRPPLSAAHFALVEYAVDEVETAPQRETLLPLTCIDCQPRRSGSAPHSPLVGRTRLWPALQRALASPRRGPLDWSANCRACARRNACRGGCCAAGGARWTS